jgi:hypothetical protein
MKIADSMSVKIGIVVVTMLAFIGDVFDSPTMKQHWLHTMLSMAAKKNIIMSRRSTFSFCTNSDVIQKHTAAPAVLKRTMSRPVIPFAMAALPIGAIKPQIMPAINMQA